MMQRMAALCLALVLGVTAGAGSARPLAGYLPAGGLGVVETPALAALWRQFETEVAPGCADDGLKQAWKRLWEGSWEKELRGIFGMQPLDLLLEYPVRLGFSVGDLGPMLKLTAAGDDVTPGAVQAALWLDGGEGKARFSGAWEQCIDALAKFAESQGARLAVRQEKHHGMSFTTLMGSNASDAAGGAEPAFTLHYTWLDTWLVLTFSRPYLEKILEVSEGAPALAAGGRYRTAKDALKWTPEDVQLFVDAAGLYAALRALMDGGAAASSEEKLGAEILDRLFGEIESIAARSTMAAGALRSEAFITCNDQARPGLLRLVGRRDNLAFPPWVWQDADVQMTLAVDSAFLQTLVPELLRMGYTAQFGPSLADAWKTQFSAFMGMDLEKDLLASIGDTFTMIVSQAEAPAGEDAEMMDLGMDSAFVIALDVRGEDPWKALLRRLIELSSGELKEQEYMGRQLVVVEDLPGFAVAVTVTDGKFLLGFRGHVEQAVRRLGGDVPGLAQDAELREAVADLGAPNAMLTRAKGESPGDSAGTLGVAGGWVDDALEEMIDDCDEPAKSFFSALKGLYAEFAKPARWEKYGVSSYGAAAWEAAGLRVKSMEKWRLKAAGSF